MSTVGYSTLDIIPSVRNLRSQIEAQTSRDLDAAGRKGGQKFGDAAGAAAGKQFKTKFGSLAKDVAAPVAGIFAGAAVVGLFKDAISGASDLAESGNKVSVVFGDATGQVEEFASKGAKALGQTRLDVLNAAATFGTFGKAAGLSGGDLADFSTKLAGLSTDLASFFNTDPSQAIESIGAALRGEAEPIRAYGVLLDDATLRQEAMRQGLIATTKQALTPQQKVLAAYQVILKQTKDAQGDFARTSGGLANQQRILSAQWSEMKTQLGTKLLPAVTAITRGFNDGVVPALGNAGGVIGDVAGSFNSLPAPVKAATAALVAFRAAQALGITSAASKGLNSTGSALDSLRLRAMLAADSYRGLRTASLETTASAHVFTPAVGRMSASLTALRTAGLGAGAGLKRGLSSAVGLIGGPWGIALAAGTLAVTHFWQEHQKAKAHVDDLTSSLNQQDGAITKLAQDSIFKSLQDSGALDIAKKYGIALDDVRQAALGNVEAQARVNTVLDEQARSLSSAATGQTHAGGAADQFAISAGHLREAIGGENDAIKSARDGLKDHAEFMGKSAEATSHAKAVTQGYASEMSAARTAVQGLLDVENKRRNANLGILGDQIALNQALADARKEAGDGKATLDLTTQAGRDNASSLRDLADAWNGSAEKVKNAKGAYRDMRQNFIDVAEKMGASETQAKKLADRLLGLPRRRAIDIDTPGMDAALRDVRDLKKGLLGVGRIVITAQSAKNQAALSDIRRANGGPIRGRGTGTSDSILMWGSNGEFMQRKAAVDYYGEDFMRRLNNLQVPKFAGGGAIGGGTTTTSAAPLTAQELAGTLRIVDGHAYIEGVVRQVLAQSPKGLSGLDGRRRP